MFNRHFSPLVNFWENLPHPYKNFLRVLGSWFIISGVYFLKSPNFIQKIYAEDGMIYLQDALNTSFPKDLVIPYAGYSDIVARIGGRIAALLPLRGASQSLFYFTTLIVALVALIIIFASRSLIKNIYVRVLLAFSLVLLPISNFESIANMTNLHFFLMSACLVIFIGGNYSKTESRFYFVFIIISCLATPLMAFLLPLIVGLKENLRNRLFFKELRILDLAWILGMLFQFLFILTTALGERKPEGVNSLERTIYLFLDRVVGSTYFPFWGYVSSNTSQAKGILGLNPLLYRGGAALLLLLVMTITFWRVLSHSASPHKKEVSAIVFTIFVYWLTLGIFFSPEPRYSIFPSFAIVVVTFLVLIGIGKATLRNRLFFLTAILLLATWIGSWSPSELRIQGPTWREDISNGRTLCLKNRDFVSVRILPLNANWSVTLPCSRL